MIQCNRVMIFGRTGLPRGGIRLTDWEEKMIQTHSLTALAAETLLGGDLLILLGIALAACVLGIQVACIVILIKKLVRAGKDRDRMEGQESRDS